MHRSFRALACACALAFGGAVVTGADSASAAVVTFTGGTVALAGGGTAVTNNAALYSNVDYYDEAGFRLDYIGNPSGQYIGNYYGGGQDVLHAHTESGMTSMRVTRPDGGIFHLDSLYVTSNTDNGGSNATGNEAIPIRASYDGVTFFYSQLLPPENWGLATTTLVNLPSQFQYIKAFEILPNSTSYCFGLDNVTLIPVPEPAGLSLLALGGLALARGRRRD